MKGTFLPLVALAFVLPVSHSFLSLPRTTLPPAHGLRRHAAGPISRSRGPQSISMAERQVAPEAEPAEAKPLALGARSPRRGALALTFLAALGLVAPSAPASAASQWSKVRGDIFSLIEEDRDFAPTLIRLAWHSSGTYDRMSKTGGSGLGTIRFKEELAHGANAGLNKAVERMEKVKAQNPDVTYADLYTLAGTVAIEALGGPSVNWRSGRKDSMDPKDVTPDGRLPDADKGSGDATAAHLREVFGRMGFSDKEIVALSGAHTVGFCHPDASGYDGPWTPSPKRFNNMYYRILINLRWDPKTLPNGLLQYGLKSGRLMMLPSDLVLIQDEGFSKYVRAYAEDESLWFQDFAEAFQRLEELGTKGLRSAS